MLLSSSTTTRSFLLLPHRRRPLRDPERRCRSPHRDPGAAAEVCEDSIPGLHVDHIDISDLPLLNTDLETDGGKGFPPAVEAFCGKIRAPPPSPAKIPDVNVVTPVFYCLTCTDQLNELNDGSHHDLANINSTGERNIIDLNAFEISHEQEYDFSAPEDSIYATSASNTTSKKPPKGQAIRSKNVTKVEDEVLCAAYLNVSKDPIVGIDQPAKSYWQRITDYYEENKKTPYSRTLSSLQHRWGEIQKDAAKFCGFYAEIERKNQGGKSDDDKVKDSLQLYEGVLKHAFKFLHCWFILRREQKWNEFLAERWKRKPKSAAPGVGVMTDGGPADGSQASPMEEPSPDFVRPMGRDRAKKLRSSSSSTGSSAACLEVLQKMQNDGTRFEERAEAQSRDESRIEDRTLQVAEESMKIQKELLTKQVNLQERALLLQEKERVDHVMGIDLDKMAPWVRNFYLKEQKEIAARAGVFDPTIESD